MRFATTPSSSCSSAAARSASPSSNCGERTMPPRDGSISASSRFLRSASGRAMSGSESSSSRSKTTRASVPVPAWSSENRERPSSSSAQISASSTASAERVPSSAARAAGLKRSVRSLPFLLVSVAWPPAIVTMARNPSHLGSKIQLSPRGSASDEVASVGAYRLATAVAPSFRRSNQFFGSPSSFAGTSVQTPSSRSPRRRTVRPPPGFSSRSSYVPRSQISTVPAPY